MANRKQFNKKASIILTNYNNEQYIYEAIDSVLEQKYYNIELIVIDDYSKKFDKKNIEKYINSKKSKNISNFKIVVNDKNIGTVKTLNKAIGLCSGYYIIFFSADDKLASCDVISNFVNCFEKSNYNVITSQWIICDEKLRPIRNFISNNKKLRNMKYLFGKMCCSNIFGSGATCYKKCIFEKYGLFDEKYKYLEDWPYWINLLKSEELIYYDNFDGLLHRSGGISQSNMVSETTKAFYKEILNTYINEIFPIFNKLSIRKKMNVLKSFSFSISSYENFIDCEMYNMKLRELLKNNFILNLLWKKNKIMPNTIDKVSILYKFNKVVFFDSILTIGLSFLFVNLFNIKKDCLLSLSVLTYIVLYYILSIMCNFKKMLIRRK